MIPRHACAPVETLVVEPARDIERQWADEYFATTSQPTISGMLKFILKKRGVGQRLVFE